MCSVSKICGFLVIPESGVDFCRRPSDIAATCSLLGRNCAPVLPVFLVYKVGKFGERLGFHRLEMIQARPNKTPYLSKCLIFVKWESNWEVYKFYSMRSKLQWLSLASTEVWYNGSISGTMPIIFNIHNYENHGKFDSMKSRASENHKNASSSFWLKVVC